MQRATYRAANYARRAAVSGLVASLLIAASAGTADASAVGYAKVSGFCFEAQGHEVCLPTITLGHFIKGDGRAVSRQEASVQDAVGADTTVLKSCNWRFDWRYSDTNGRTYLISKGTQHNSCAFGGSIGRIDKTKRTLKHYGKACVDFVINGKRRASQCHFITK